MTFRRTSSGSPPEPPRSQNDITCAASARRNAALHTTGTLSPAELPSYSHRADQTGFTDFFKK